MLKCKTCTSNIHYHCSGLPNFEIVKYLGQKSRKYICEKCTVVIPKNRNKLGDSEKPIKFSRFPVSTSAQQFGEQVLQYGFLVDNIRSVMSKELKAFQSEVLVKFKSNLSLVCEA